MMHSTLQSNKVFFHLMLLIIAIPLIFWPNTQDLINAWKSNTTYNHGFFIFPISLWLLYRQRNLISSTETATEPRLLGLLALALLLWFLSYIISVNVTQQFALIALIPISIWILFGRKLLIKIIFPIAFMFFMIPVGGSLVPPLMEITADITVSMIELSGIPVFRDGLYFTLPTGNWSVVEACSGLNYLVASVTLGLLYSYLSYSSLKKRIVFVAAITLFAVVANGLRAYGIVIIGHLTNMRYGAGGDHEFYGWLFYAFFVFWVFYVGNIWADKPILTHQKNTVTSHTPISNGIPKILFFIVFSIMISVQVLAKQALQINTSDSPSIDFTLPDHFGDWRYSPAAVLGWKPQIVGASIKKTESYMSGKDKIQISLGYYPQQSQGSEAVSWQNKIIGGESRNWTVLAKSGFKFDGYSVTEIEAVQQGRKILIWQWYLVGEWRTPNPNIAKIFDAINIVLFRRNDASFITLATPVDADRLESRKRLVAFYKAAHEELHGTLSSAISGIF